MIIMMPGGRRGGGTKESRHMLDCFLILMASIPIPVFSTPLFCIFEGWYRWIFAALIIAWLPFALFIPFIFPMKDEKKEP